jgi:hypothetical protein
MAARYRATQQGETVCVSLRAGALRIAWYQSTDVISAMPEALSQLGVLLSAKKATQL